MTLEFEAEGPVAVFVFGLRANLFRDQLIQACIWYVSLG